MTWYGFMFPVAFQQPRQTYSTDLFRASVYSFLFSGFLYIKAVFTYAAEDKEANYNLWKHHYD